MASVHDVSIHRRESLGIEAVQAHSQRAFDRHTHEQFGIGIVTHGAQRSASCAGPVEARQGDLITVHPGEVHDGKPVDAKPRAWRMLYLEPSLIADLALDRTEGASADYEFCSPVLRAAAPYRYLARLHQALICASTPCETVEEALITLLADLRRTGDASPRASRAVPAAITQVLAMMRDDPAHPFALDELAAVAQLSRYQLIRGVSAATGLTPHTYLMQARLDRARQMIRGGRALSDTALACGFADQSHLNRVFVRRHGLTPGAYARAFRAGERR